MPILFLSQRGESAAAALAAAGIAGRTELVGNPVECLQRLERGGFELVLIDAAAAGGGAVDLVEPLAAAGQAVVVLADRPSLALTVRSLRSGASDVLAFPPSAERLRQLADDVAGARPVAAARSVSLGEWVGESPALLGPFRAATRLAVAETPVLIAGEPGTGKESLARVMHELSGRAGGPFVVVNCGVLPEPVLQSELFGHESGALPGVYGKRVGRFVKAAGGTLFLDELNELVLRLQHMVVRALRDRAVEPVGAAAEVAIDARLIATVTRPPGELLQDADQVPDLIHAFGGAVLTLPPLRDRGEADIRLLAERFLAEFAARYERPVQGIADDAWNVLVQHPWPGNVRQLRSALERAVVDAEGDVIHALHLPRDIRRTAELMPQDGSLLLEDLEKRHILRVLELAGGHLGKTAELLGIHRNTLRRKLQGYGIAAE